jgi:hypothetical protein
MTVVQSTVGPVGSAQGVAVDGPIAYVADAVATLSTLRLP